MAHPRKLVRHAAVDGLVGMTAAGARVEATRVEPHRKNGLPAIVVYTPDEEIDEERSTGEPRELVREVDLLIAGFVAHTDAIPMDDAMDDIAEQIEAAMDVNRYLGGTASETILRSTTMQYRAEDGRSDPTVGIVTLTYSVTYRTTPAVATLDDFLRVKTTHQLEGGVSDTPPAIDEFAVQEAP